MKFLFVNFNISLLFFCSVMLIVRGGEIDDDESGSFLFLSKNEELVEDETKLVGKNLKPQCQEETLSSFLYSLQVINPESVIALAIKNKLEQSCANVSNTMEKMQAYLKSCSLQPQQETYKRILKGITTLHKKICTNDPYYKSFMEFKKCFTQLQSEFDSCNGPADWTDNSDRKKVCNAYQEVADCYYIKTSVLCGNQAADVFKELVNAVIDSVITVNCSNIATVGNLSKQLNDSVVLNEEPVGVSASLKPLQIISVVLMTILMKQIV